MSAYYFVIQYKLRASAYAEIYERQRYIDIILYV